MNIAYEDKRAINGTYGMVFLEGEVVREATALKAEIELKFLDVPMCGDLMDHQKVSGMAGNGSITMTKVNSRMILLLSKHLKEGRMPSFTIVSKLADPDAFGAERIVLKNCKFSSLTLADWADNKIGETTQPFTFTDWDLLDTIDTSFQ